MVEKEDAEVGVKYYMLAAGRGHFGAQFNLGVCYDTGEGVEKDEKEAVWWYELSKVMLKRNAILVCVMTLKA